MVEYMLSQVICTEFEKVVGKGQSETGKAMHIGFSMNTENDDQYSIQHLYLFAPGNYVYVVTQEERILLSGDRQVGHMKMLCYHDSCWRSSVQEFISKNSKNMSVMKAYKNLYDWYDVLTLDEDEKKFLRKMESWKHGYPYPKGEFEEPNPFDVRGFWASRK